MKTNLLSLVILTSFFAATAHADVIHCGFTEPFFSLQIDTEKKTITKIEPNWESPDGEMISTVISKNAKVEIKKLEGVSSAAHVPVYVVYDGKKEVITLKLNYQGSDGMSDFAYPYETGSFDGYFGGCDSNILKRHVFYHEGQEPGI